MSITVSNKIYLHEAITYFMVPFSFGETIGAGNFEMPKDALWKPATLNIDQDVFYGHIQDFLMSSVMGKGKGKRDNYEFLIYSLKPSPLKDVKREPVVKDTDQLSRTKLQKNKERRALRDIRVEELGQDDRNCLMINKLLENVFCLKLPDKHANGGANVNKGYRYIPFKISNNSKLQTFDSPKLMVYPDASVGILIVPISFNVSKPKGLVAKGSHMPDELVAPITMFDYMAANNTLKKNQENRHKYVYPLRSCKVELMKQLALLPEEDERFLSIKARNHLIFEEESQKTTCDMIYEVLNINQAANGGVKDYSNFSFDLSDIIDLLLRMMKVDYERLNKRKNHTFSYFQIEEEAMPDNDTEQKEFFSDFVRIIRGEHVDFKIVDSVKQHVYIQTFENIYMGSSVEGAAILTMVSKNRSDEFIEKFKEKSIDKRYFWIYILSYVQRLSLINMVRELGGIDNTSDKNIIVPLGKLRDLSKRLSRIQVNTFYSAVSDISQHNEFYRLCTLNLGIDQLKEEVRRKMQILNDCLVQVYDELQGRRARIITFMVAIFALISASCDLFDLLSNYIDGHPFSSYGEYLKSLTGLHYLIGGTFFVVLILILSWFFRWRPCRWLKGKKRR